MATTTRYTQPSRERIKTLEGRVAKDSHNSSLPPSSDRFVRVPKSLRKKSGKKPGGQPGHRGHHLKQVERPDDVLISLPHLDLVHIFVHTINGSQVETYLVLIKITN